MRAGVAFVLVSLVIGSGFREWRRSNEVRFADLVRELEGGTARAGSAEDPPAASTRDSTRRSEPGYGTGSSHRRRAPEPALRPHGIDLDRATATELERLPGIGPSLAAKIVADRDRNGPFDRPDALLRVPGIGPRKLELIRPYLATPRAPADSGSPIAN